MDQGQVHFELFIKRAPGAPWSLDMASESRDQVVEAAQALMAEKRVAAVRVTKEILNAETREFRSVVVLTEGKIEEPRKQKVVEDREPLCVSPSDLYTIHARHRIGRLLEAWLARSQATPFELLHRPDLVERLDAAGVELQHAVQKIAVPEAQARGLSTHELIRSFQGLIERSVARVLKDGRRGAFPDLASEGFVAAAERLSADPEAGYLLGAGVAAQLAGAANWSEKVARLMDLADHAPTGQARKLAFDVLEQPLAEILETRAGITDLLGSSLDLGGRLAAMTRLAASEAVTRLVAAEPSVARAMPPLEGPAQRLAALLEKGSFVSVRAAVGRRILQELMGPRRLRPSDPVQEIELLRSLAMALTAAASQLLPAEDVHEAFVARSRMLVTAEFVEGLLGRDESARQEAEQLIWLTENVIGAANKRQAARYLMTHVGSLRFEKELRYGPDSPTVRLAALAVLQRDAGRAGLTEEDLAPIQTKLGDIGGAIEADSKIAAMLAQAQAPVGHRLALLLRLATGEAAPLGPAADRARAAALKLLRSETARAELAGAPEQLAQVRDLMQAAGLAA
ncbi:MAG: hypothetical protein JO127_06570 [Caulobacteraceae bacterium]|nr:hypothetical protein [Caulobacteraceae bacterium]